MFVDYIYALNERWCRNSIQFQLLPLWTVLEDCWYFVFILFFFIFFFLQQRPVAIKWGGGSRNHSLISYCNSGKAYFKSGSMIFTPGYFKLRKKNWLQWPIQCSLYYYQTGVATSLTEKCNKSTKLTGSWFVAIDNFT